MSKRDWGALQQEFNAAHSRSGISPEDWCEARGLNYNTARRYIKKTLKTAQSELRNSAQKKLRKKTTKTAQKQAKKDEEKNSENFPHDNGHDDDGYMFNPGEFGLSEQQAIFAEFVSSGKTLVEAYRLAGYKAEGNAVHAAASRLLRNVKVYRAIRWLRDKRQRRLALTEDEIIHQLSAIASADPNEISQIRRMNCRYCWGHNHKYQWRDMDEYHAAQEKMPEGGAPEYGGIGFFESAVPNPECPRCGGEGIPDIYFADTTMIDGPARWLIAGVRQTMNGLEVKIASQEAARRELLRILERHQASKPTEPQIPGEDYQLQELTPDEAVPKKPVL
ncbi:terminase small subunit [Salmonella enterica subsp. enterica serovar Oranienburg]|nr:terminase small subunit [Salmonella enterica subsp. enterica serovar Oranienburg]HAF8817954.1 terminase small subunit [Salmonella enterica]